MTYKVYSEDSYGLKRLVFTTDSYSKAYHFCKRKNAENARYLEECQDNWEQPGNVIDYWFERVKPTDEVRSAKTSFTRTYYPIYEEHENGIRKFLCIVEQEWIAKDFCEKHHGLVYDTIKVVE